MLILLFFIHPPSLLAKIRNYRFVEGSSRGAVNAEDGEAERVKLGIAQAKPRQRPRVHRQLGSGIAQLPHLRAEIRRCVGQPGKVG